MNDTAAAEYPGWNVRLKASYPLDDTEQKAFLRNAYLKTKQAELTVDNMKMEIRDEVLSRMERVRMQHVMLAKAKTVRSESELYYQKILVRFGQGKAKSLDMRNALDSMVQSRQQELEALVLYNVALLQFDLAKNEIFERYGVDVEKYLKMVKE
jgi:outer membrane protein TolC